MPEARGRRKVGPQFVLFLSFFRVRRPLPLLLGHAFGAVRQARRQHLLPSANQLRPEPFRAHGVCQSIREFDATRASRRDSQADGRFPELKNQHHHHYHHGWCCGRQAAGAVLGDRLRRQLRHAERQGRCGPDHTFQLHGDIAAGRRSARRLLPTLFALRAAGRRAARPAPTKTFSRLGLC